MKIVIRETGEQQTLEMIAPDTGIDYVQDFIGNTGALANGQFVYDYDQDAYVCDNVTFEWWNKVCADNEALEERIYRLRKEHGDNVYDVIATHCDLEDHAASVNAALDEAFGEDA